MGLRFQISGGLKGLKGLKGLNDLILLILLLLQSLGGLKGLKGLNDLIFLNPFNPFNPPEPPEPQCEDPSCRVSLRASFGPRASLSVLALVPFYLQLWFAYCLRLYDAFRRCALCILHL